MISDEAFSNPANAKAIQEELNNLKNISRNLPHDKLLSQPVLRDSAAKLQNHLGELADNFDVSRTYSRYLLNSTLTACSTCHAQLPQQGHPLFRFDADSLKGSDFQRAEFLYAIRQFPEALKLYEKVLKNPDMQNQKMRALDRGLAIHLLHEHDPKKAIAWVKSFPVRHDDERALSENYLRYVNSLKEVKIPKIDAATSAQIAAFAEEMLNSPDNIARRLLASGVLHDFIQHQNTTKRKVNAEIYYWAGVCDRPLQSSFVFSLVQDYFETCIQAEPKSVQAKKCFEGLEEEVLNSYSGSDGTSLPADEADKLNKWRHQAGLKPKKYK